MAAVGDSFTAGIGSGNVHSSRKEDTVCSRYDYSYPSIMNQFFSSSVSNFTYLACSGDTLVDIAAQIARLSKGLDLAVMTAGGNYLCLTTIIKTCILNSVTSESSCQKAIKIAQTAIDGILEDNIVSLLNSLDDKMDDRGIIVLSSFPPYFDNMTSDCTNNEDWVFPGQAGSTSLLLSTSHRTYFHTLVANTNAKLKSAVDKVARTASSTVVFADWSAWGEAAGGRFCEKGSSPDPSSSTNDYAMFYKLPTYKVFNPGTVYRRDLNLGSDPMLGISSNTTSVQEGLEAEEANWDQIRESISNPLSKRDAPTTGVCGTNSGGGWLPDQIGKIFHPTNFGHEAIASYVTFAIGNAVAKKEQTTTPACNLVETSLAIRVRAQNHTPAPTSCAHTRRSSAKLSYQPGKTRTTT
ncbi:SGNH hydrolase [Penicillium hordei]|uniref:SGNH hydrolase n=1 Tax=Penicillium hordei TaxID=40994 RepID=A0AAD6EC22_9EURO|nr:SGNH hydrolase [Penicillium hordei]KAJ5608124.1 SGNH hydrolase [Penicillium hordei]